MKDESGRFRFLPTFLARFSPSPDYEKVELVEKTVERISWSEETITESNQFVRWFSPNCLIRSGVAPYPAQVFLHVSWEIFSFVIRKSICSTSKEKVCSSTNFVMNRFTKIQKVMNQKYISFLEIIVFST